MSDLTIIVLGLLAAAFLGNVIGWCARRLISIRDEANLIARFEKEQRSLTEQLNEADERIEQLGDQKKATERQTSALRSQIAQLRLRHDDQDVLVQEDARKDSADDGAREKIAQQLQQLERNLEQQTAQNTELRTELDAEREKSSAAAQELARLASESPQQQTGIAVPAPMEIPVLSKVRSQDPAGSQAAPLQQGLAASVEQEIDASKYAFPDMGTGWLDVDQDLLGYSPAEEAYEQQTENGVATALATESTQVRSTGRDEENVMVNSGNPVTTAPDGVTSQARASRTDGMFSRFNRRKK